MTTSSSLSTRLQAWAAVMSEITQVIDSEATTWRLLAEGARAVLGAEWAALCTVVSPQVLQISALAGVAAQDVALIETVLTGNATAKQINLLGASTPLAQAYFERREIFLEKIPESGPHFAASHSLQAALQQTLNLNSWWILPLAVTPDQACEGLIILGRATVTPPSVDDRSLVVALITHATLALQTTHEATLAAVGQQMTETASASLELGEVAIRVLAFATQLIPCDSAVLFLRYGDLMRVYAVSQLPRELIGNEFNLASPHFDYVITTRTPLYVADVQTDPRFVQILEQEQMHGWLAVPLVVGERVIGLLSLYSKTVGRFGAPEAELAQALGRQAALALENAQLYHEATRHLQQMAILNEISAAIMSTPNFNEAMRLVMWALKRSLRYEWVNVWMLNEANDRLELVTPELGAPVTSLRLGEGVSGQVALRGEALRLDDARQFAYPHVAPEVRSLVSVPIRIGVRLIGVIDAQSSRLAAFNDDDVYVLSIVAGQLARALENARLSDLQRQRTAETVALLDIAETISSSLELSAVLEAVAQRTLAACEVTLCVIFLSTDEASHFRLGSYAVDPTVTPPPVWEQLTDLLQQHPLRDFPRTQQSFLTGRTQVVEPTSGTFVPFLAQITSQKKFLLVPLRISDHSVGMMVLGYDDAAREFQARQVSLAAAIGRQLAVAVENAHLYARTQQNVRELSASILQLKETQTQLVQSGKLAAVGQLAAGVAHEINNPLTTITGFSEIVLRELPEGSPLKNDLQMIVREAQRARDVVRRLLDFARQSEPHRDPADLNEVARETAALMRNAAAVRSVTVHEDYAPDLPWVKLDVNQFKQVILNLLNNAVQAMPKGGMLTMSTGVQTREDRLGVWLQVRDTGVGIPPENLERIFEPFFTTKSPDQGTGLGLAVSYRIVHEHEGLIEVASQVGHGTTFVVWLPVTVE